MATVKHALISPAINAQPLPNAEDEKQLFEEKFGQMAYQAFSSKFPDLVPEIVTFKILDSDLEIGTGIGAFILEQEGDYIYIPAIISENELKPFDLMYVKSKDIFLPLSTEWLDEVSKGTVDSLGEGVKLPDTVATDVDIRNIIVPPTTGRYSYANFEVSPQNRLAAMASEPLGRRITKLAAVGPFPGGGGGGGGGSGAVGDTDFNPELWATFTEQFQRVQQSSPGQALDGGMVDAETLAKMYKSHQKTWEMMNSAGPAGAAMQEQQMMQQGMPAQGMPQQGMPQQQMPQQQGMQVTASVQGEVAQTMGSKLDGLLLNAAKSGLVGAGAGGLAASGDDDMSDVPGAMFRGAMGGMLAAPIGGIIGEDAAARFSPSTSAMKSRGLGNAIGAAAGGYLGGSSDPEPAQYHNNYANASFSLGDAARSLVPGLGLLRMASDHTEGLRAMIKHAQGKNKYVNKLPEFLSRSPNTVKRAYIRILDRNPRLLKQAVDLYGEKTLTEALTQKKAAVSSSGGGLYIADSKSKKTDFDTFGEQAATAFTGVLTRGYYYKDTRKDLNVAAHVQDYHTFQDALNSGVYSLYTQEGEPKPALVLVEPLDLLSSDRFTFPRNENQVKPMRNRVPSDSHRREPHNLGAIERELPDAPDVERSHKFNRMAILGNGDYTITEKLFGQETVENQLKGTSLWNSLWSEKPAKPSRGKGCFVAKKGSSYVGSLPVEITELSTGSDGVVRGKMSAIGGWSAVAFVIDPRSPVTRPQKLRDQRLVILPPTWAWVSLNEAKEADDFLRTADAMHRVVLNTMHNMNVKKASVRDAGQNMFALDQSGVLPKKDALVKIARTYGVHASAAEAMLKIASHEGVCHSYIMSPQQYRTLSARVKIAQGMAVPQTPMGAPPAMQQPAPAAQPMPPTAPEAAAPPAPAMPSAVDQAFGESMDSLQQQMSQLQAQLDVLSMVQQRAMEIETGQSQDPNAPPPDMSQSMQGMPPGMDPSMGAAPPAPPAPGGMGGQPPMPPGQDPAAMGMDPSMMGGQDPAAMGQDPSMMQPQEPAMPIMNTEEPSAEEIAQQINPTFLEDASRLHETGAFDAGTIASLAQNSTMKSITSNYAANLESSIDDLGRSLLTLYMQESQLKEQLGDQTFVDLETQLRDTFHGLGKLVLSMTHNATMLDPHAIA